MPTAIALLRVSTPDQQLGLSAQQAAIDRFAAERGIDVLSIHTEIVSGGADLSERYGLAAASADVAARRADHLLVAKRDRLARDPIVAMLTERSLEGLGATVLCADGNNATDPASELMRGMLDVFARFERRMISIRTKAALDVLRSQGKKLGKPFGARDKKPGSRKRRSDRGKKHNKRASIIPVTPRAAFPTGSL